MRSYQNMVYSMAMRLLVSHAEAEDVAQEVFLRAYEQATNSHDITQLVPLIAPEAVYWFSDGSHRGREAVLSAIAETFATIRDEVYQINDVEWIAHSDDHAVCRYRFAWTGTIDGQPQSGNGRGTNVLVSNAGPATATGIAVTDTLPANLSFVPGSIRSGTSCAAAATVEDDDNAGGDESDPFGASWSGPVLSAATASLANGAAMAIRFDATVN